VGQAIPREKKVLSTGPETKRKRTELQVKRKKLNSDSGVLEKRLRNGWRKRQVTLVVSHKALP
jgi:hypothetical protein